MRFSRHARNGMRLYRVTERDVEGIVANPAETGQDERGNDVFVGFVDGRRIRVVLAADDPGFVITVHERRA
ncbi:DUF4258 domain-containing protein [Miltoncostaea marina]|uniref:DUF4258 domain-containing protein n=1 Tax=Miltoncostaea marina TaxID=2843215 RepID=UPI001C3CF65A|nr:DUF4258 domain-containing protein [Miltoncostaea marina]